jgi:hypothetical protein
LLVVQSNDTATISDLSQAFLFEEEFQASYRENEMKNILVLGPGAAAHHDVSVDAFQINVRIPQHADQDVVKVYFMHGYLDSLGNTLRL